MNFPALKIVFEHITTAEAVEFVESVGPMSGDRHAAAPNHQPQRDVRGRPQAACLLPAGRQARGAPAGGAQGGDVGSPKFFLGTDSAPHAREAKESACGCAGIFNAPFALESYVGVFEEEGALDKFEAFASINGARFYGQPINEETVTLERLHHEVPG